jgi:hypothetical protein
MMTSNAADDRRLFDRAAVTLATDIRYGGLDCSGFTADVSAMGAFVRATDDADPLLSLLQPGDQVELRLATALAERVSVQARVVRKQSTGVGLQFHQAEPRFDAARILATLTTS